MAEELLVVLNRSESSGFGFSLLGKPGLPPIIYNILDDSPAAESGEVEVGDVILKVNETDVIRFSTKEVLKCLRLSSDPVTLKIKRDPKIKATVQKHLLQSGGGDLDKIDRGGGLGGVVGGNRRVPVHNNAINANPRPPPINNQQEPLLHHQQHHTNNQHARFGTTNGSCCPPTSDERQPLLLGGGGCIRGGEDALDGGDASDRLQWQPLAAAADDGESVVGSRGGKQQQPKFEAYMMTGEHILNISRVPPYNSATSIVPKHQKKADNPRYQNSHAHHLRHQPAGGGGGGGTTPPHTASTVPNSPNESEVGRGGGGAHSAGASPAAGGRRADHRPPQPLPLHNHNRNQQQEGCQQQQNSYVRTSRSEDQLQGQTTTCIVSAANAEADEDVTSSLNTLLDTRPDSSSSASGGVTGGGDSDRIVWTYNAPLTDQQRYALAHYHFATPMTAQATPSSMGGSNGSSSPSTASSPMHSGSPNSPTSVSSSVMSSHSGSRRLPYPLPNGPSTTSGGFGQPHHDLSISEAVSNISSPDYHDDDDSVGLRDCMMECSDHSDSDSTLLVSEPHQQQQQRRGTNGGEGDHRIVIQVRGPGGGGMAQQGRADATTTVWQDIQADLDNEEEGTRDGGKSSPLSSEDESDVESLHSFHYSPKAVDMPSAIRLAKRLYCLDGFKKSDVSRHLSKNNDFSRAVAEEYLKYFNFEKDTLDVALRKFLKQFSLTGETQERERVLVHFSKRYLDCNPGSFNSQDAVHTLTCAIMLLNTDLHGQSIGRKMTCNEFIENLAGLNERENFPREVLKQLYHAIKNHPLEWALDEETEDGAGQAQNRANEVIPLGANPFLEVPTPMNAIEYKKGYVMRKCCYETNAKRTPFHKRSWKMFYCTLRDLVLYLHKDENGFRKGQLGDNLHNAIRVHHALATKAADYTKKQFVFRLQTADQAEYLFQTSDSKELQSWIDTINFVAASFSAPPLEAAVGSQKKFQRPLLPCSHTKLSLREQLMDHEERVMRLEAMLDDHRKSPPEKGSKSLVIQNYREKEAYLTFEIKRYRTYAYMLRSRMSQYPELGISLAENSIGEVEEPPSGGGVGGSGSVTIVEGAAAGSLIPPPIPDRPSPTVNRRGPE